MNKILWAMLSLIILGLGFLLLMKNPTWIVAQKTLPVMGLERLLGQTNLIATMSGTHPSQTDTVYEISQTETSLLLEKLENPTEKSINSVFQLSPENYVCVNTKKPPQIQNSGNLTYVLCGDYYFINTFSSARGPMIYGIFYSGDVSTLRCYGENDACYFVRAIGNNNTQDCNQIRNNSSKERCLTTLALTTDSPSICYTLKEPSPQVYAKTNTEYCLNLLMGKYGKENRLTEKFCIENPPIANVCYSTLVHIEDDISYCYKINDQGNTIYNTQKSCVMNTIKWDYDKKNPKNFTSADCEFMKDDPIAEQSCYKKLKDPTVAFCYNGGCSGGPPDTGSGTTP